MKKSATTAVPPPLHIACCILVGLFAAGHPATAVAVDVFVYVEPQHLVKTFSYTSTASGAQSWVMNATIVESPSGPEQVDGQSYRVRIQKTEGIDGYAPADQRVFYREQENGLYTGYYDGNGQFTEYLHLPVDVEIGESWQGPSGYWDSESFTSISRFESAAGEFPDCLRITRVRSIEGPPRQQMTSNDIYCPEIGHVHTRVDHAFEGFQSTTEMELVNIE